jgi:predicted ATPase/DNA-binding SARP family transcriptional activator/DNA-binding CsgD family transcriptional regulator/Tfp pilus assembly protein PilF
LPGQPSGANIGPVGLAIHLLGRFVVSIGEVPIPETAWRSRTAAKVVKLLALAPGHRLHRDQVVDILWPNLEPRAATNNLYRALHAARHLLEPDLPPRAASAHLGLHWEMLALGQPGRAPGLWIDVDEFEAAAQLARSTHDPNAYSAALALYTGDLLPDDRYDDWMTGRREQLHQRYADVLRDAAQTYEALGDVNAAIDALRRLVAAQPTDEVAHLTLMRLLALAGRRDQALREFKVLEAALRQDLGAEPRPSSRLFYRELQAGGAVAKRPEGGSGAITAAPVSPRPPADTLARSSRALTNLPSALTSFIGRDAEQAEVRALLQGSRLVTLTGAGGCGKTRLSLEVAASVASSYVDGVWLVELAPLVEPELVPAAVAQCLAVTEQPGRTITQTMAAALRNKRLLLVLDNCDHVVDACASLVVVLLSTCPWVRVLATSRERLRCAGETTWQVPPLLAPDPQQQLPVDVLARYDAIQLFVARARTSQAAFRLTPHNAQSVAQICHRLDGIPLAIELAAVRLQVLSADEVAARLDDLLGLLSRGERTAPPRQQTVRATLDWSYGLLDAPEQALMRAVSVFSGGFNRDAAERVSDTELGPSSRALVDLLMGLVDKSLVVVDRRADQNRYWLLETVRQYGIERLRAAGDELRIRQRHRDWCLELAEDGTAALDGPQRSVAMERLKADGANVQAALATCHERGEIDYAFRLAGALWRFWFQQGDVSGGRHWLELLLGDGRSKSVPAAIRVRMLLGAGWFAFHQGDLRTATARFTESLSMGDSAAGALALLGLGNVAEERGDLGSAAASYRESLALEREQGQPPRIARVLDHLAQLACAAGEDEQALRLTDEALAVRHSAGDELGVAKTLWNRGVALLHLGDFEGAERALGESLRIWRGVGDALGVAQSTSFLGNVAIRRGDVAQASAFYAEDLTIARANGIMWGLLAGFLGMSFVLGRRGQPDRAARLLGCADAVMDTTGIIVKPGDQGLFLEHRQHIREQLGESAFQRALHDGYALPLDDAVEAALAVWTRDDTSPPAEQLSNGSPKLLTTREREIVALIAGGGTNRQIATNLALSQRTVDTHVSRILHKCGLSSRTQLAGYDQG